MTMVMLTAEATLSGTLGTGAWATAPKTQPVNWWAVMISFAGAPLAWAPSMQPATTCSWGAMAQTLHPGDSLNFDPCQKMYEKYIQSSCH